MISRMNAFALISDIHANLAALEAVLADIRTRGVKRILCLGDVVGYGPDPAACLTLVRRHCALSLMGNHDFAVLTEPLGFNKVAKAASVWTRRQIKPHWYSWPGVRRNWRFLKNAPERREENGMLFVHASPRDPIMEYIEEAETLDMGFGPSAKIEALFDLIEGACFVGHTHRPGVINADYEFLHPADIGDVWPHPGERAIVNVGSVGQPRDGDPRACYVVVEDGAVRYVRVPYDIDKTVARFRAVPELDDHLAERLVEGQ